MTDSDWTLEKSRGQLSGAGETEGKMCSEVESD